MMTMLTGTWCAGPFGTETGIFRNNWVNTMPADALDPYVTKPSAALV